MNELELFSGLNDAEKKQIPKLARPRTYKKGQIVFEEGSPCDRIFLICSGKISLTKYLENGREITLDIIGEGYILGEAAIFENTHNTFHAIALEDSFCCICHGEDFLELLKKSEISMKIIAYFIKKLNSYTENYYNFAFNDVKQRVLGILTNLANRYGETHKNGTAIDFYLSHEDISNMVNASRVMVTHVINRLKAENAISLSERRYVVHKK
jgi:CRP/FNR family transcriptional regulator